ncbi:MAG: hypothetical protein R3240_08405, partial [Gammaproteobacteria bacterium]|nr:hypothetical protein [Gammaproteobacteria bacterium]
MEAQKETGNNQCKTFWSIIPESPEAPPKFTQKDLKFKFQHLIGPHSTIDIDPSPYLGPLQVDAGAFAPGIRRAGVVKNNHETQAGNPTHHDVYSWNVEVDAEALGSIEVTSKHLETPRPAGWSYEPDENGTTFIEVWTSYAVGNDKPVAVDDKFKNKDGKLWRDAKGSLAAGGNQGPATDWKIRATYGDPVTTDLTLAFIEGTAGQYSKAEIGLMNEFFTGGDDYYVPMLFDQ